MAKQEDLFKNVLSHAKEYGFVFQSSEIYDGLSAVYDYGQNGAELKKNIREYWWKSMVQMHENIVGIDAAIFMHPTTWKASGHVDAFNDPLIDNKDSKKRYRADVLIEDYAEKLNQKAQKEFSKKIANRSFIDLKNFYFKIVDYISYEYGDIDLNPLLYNNYLLQLSVELMALNIDTLLDDNKIVNVQLLNQILFYKSNVDSYKQFLNTNDYLLVESDIVNFETFKKIKTNLNLYLDYAYDLRILVDIVRENKNIFINISKQNRILKRLAYGLENNLADVKALIEELEIADPDTGSKNWTEVRQFNLMFGTKLGAEAANAMDLYLRPETAQGIFVNFLNVQKTGRMKIPFGIAQTGKAFRNEIVARQFIFRMREFEQMEMQFFVRPGEEMKWYEYWKEKRLKWHKSLGLGEGKYRFHDHEKLAHYANAAADIEFDFPFGFKELEGIHSRTDFDLKAHEQYSGKKLQYFDAELNENYTPYVVETSVGLDRMFLAVFSSSLKEETLEDGSTRTVLSLPAVLAPTKAAVLPLVKKDGLPELAREIIEDLKWDFNVAYDEKDAVGRRYRRQDALGTPFCITVDHQTLEDNTVTIRHRDTMAQDRVKISDLRNIINEEVSVRNWLMKMK